MVKSQVLWQISFEELLGGIKLDYIMKYEASLLQEETGFLFFFARLWQKTNIFFCSGSNL